MDFFGPCDLQIWWMTSKNNRAHLLYYIKLCASFQTHWGYSNCSCSPETFNLGQNWRFSVLCDLEIWWMTLTNNRAPLLCYFKLCKSFDTNRSDSPETPNSAQNQGYLSLVTLKFHGWPWKTIGQLFYDTSRFEHHFVVICEFDLKLQSEKSQFWVKIDIFLALWPWNLTDNLEKQ